MLILVVGRVIKVDFEEKIMEFHFHGCFLGYKINKIKLASSHDFLTSEVGEEYCVLMNGHKVENNVLHGQVEKIKKIDKMGSYI